MAERVPGTIVTIVNDTGTIAAPVIERYPMIIGEGDVYKIIRNKKITRTTGSVDPIPTVSTVQEIVRVGDLPDVAGYTASTDYTLSGNNISWAGAADEPTLGDDYYITFTESRAASAFDPQFYLDANSVIANHGESTRSDDSINPLTVGAKLALNNGAGGVWVCQLDTRTASDPENPTGGELETAFTAARDKINAITDNKLFLVPMSSGTLDSTSAASIFFNHAVLASQPDRKQERTVVVAAPQSTTYQQFGTLAASFDNERAVVPACPSGKVRVVGQGDTDRGMEFYNAALAGRLCSVDVGYGISGETIGDVTFPSSRNYTPAELEFLVQNGVSPAKVYGEIVRNVFAITTDTTNALTEDLAIQDIKDYVKKYLRDGLFPLYRNKPITKGLLRGMFGTMNNFLNILQVDEGIIQESRNVSVAQDSVEPRKILVTAEVKPAYSTQFIDVTFTFVLN